MNQKKRMALSRAQQARHEAEARRQAVGALATRLAREQQRNQAAGKRMLVVGLAAPAVATLAVALLVWPDSLIQWLIVAATPFGAAAGVALFYMIRSRNRASV